MPLPDRDWHEHGQGLDHAGYADSVGYGEFKSLTRDRRTPGGTPQTEFRRSMAVLGNLPAIPANLLCDKHGQDEAKHGQDGAQDGQDGPQDGQDEVPDGQDTPVPVTPEAKDDQDDAQDRQDEAPEGQDEAQNGRRGHRDNGFFFHVQNEWISDVKESPLSR